MGSLATASYIAGISGCKYENDIDKFIAVGAPFGGSGLAILADRITKHPFDNFAISIPAPLYAKRGPAYEDLRPGSKAITELQDAWNKNFESFYVRFYSLQGYKGDKVVSWKSSLSLKGSIYVMMPEVFHTKETKDSRWQEEIYNFLWLP